MGFKKILVAGLAAGTVISLCSVAAMADTERWYQDDIGWRYYSSSTGFVRGDWKQVNGKWYYFNSSGYMISDAENFRIQGIDYNFDKSGACTNPYAQYQTYTGWHKVSRSFTDYYVDREVKILVDWYYFDSDGVAYKGWHTIDGKTYHFDDYSGEMSYYHGDTLSPYWVDENYYWFKASGEMATGWINYNGTWYYADSEGALCCYDWLCIGGKWYYFDDECRMVAGANNYLIGDILYDFDSSGACLNPYAASNPEVQTGWISVYEYGYKNWYYIDDNSELATGWKQIDGKWYYFDEYDGRMRTGVYGKHVDEVQYYLKDSGEMAVGWFVFSPSYGSDAKAAPSGYWGYAEPNGVLCRNKWRRIDGDWYYFDNKGFMIANATNYTIDGVDYNFNSSGVCTNPYPETKTITGWYKQSYDGKTTWYYYDSEGNMYKDKWLQYNGDWYFFLPNGVMCTVSYTTDCIHFYDFDTNGVCMNPYNVRIDESCC